MSVDRALRAPKARNEACRAPEVVVLVVHAAGAPAGLCECDMGGEVTEEVGPEVDEDGVWKRGERGHGGLTMNAETSLSEFSNERTKSVGA